MQKNVSIDDVKAETIVNIFISTIDTLVIDFKDVVAITRDGASNMTNWKGNWCIPYCTNSQHLESYLDSGENNTDPCEKGPDFSSSQEEFRQLFL